jgi:sarcosine oxidase subunit beta
MRKLLVPQSANRTADAVVIGGGIVGAATAYWLSRAGLDTVVVEARNELGGLTTAASAECFRAQFTEPAIAPLALESIEFFKNFNEMTGLTDWDLNLRQHGYLFVTDDESMLEDMEAMIAEQHRLGVLDSEFIPAGDLRKRFPYLEPTVQGATFRRADGWLSVHELLQGYVKASDAAFYLSTRVTGIESDADGVRAVVTDRGRIETRTVVDAAGPFAGAVAEMVGVPLPLEAVLRQKAFVVTPSVPEGAPFTVDLVNGSYWRPEPGGGLVGWVNPDTPAGPPLENPVGDWDFPAYALDKASRLSPFWADVAENLTKPDVSVSAGQYVYTPDQQPLIGPVPEVPGFHLNCGYWIGVMISPAVGRLCADLITGARAPQDNLLRLSRYEEGLSVRGASFLSGH